MYACFWYLSGESKATPQLRLGGVASNTSSSKQDNQVESNTSESKQGDQVESNTSASEQNSGSGTSTICARLITFDLSDTSKWPGTYTPSYFKGEPPNNEQGVLIKSEEEPRYDHPDDKFRVINDFFVALDLAYEKKCQVYITKDANWFWETFISLFFGKDYQVSDEFWSTMQDTLGVIILNNEEDVKALAKEWTIITPNQQIQSSSLTAKQVMERRDTVFRKIFQHSPTTNKHPLCKPITLWALHRHWVSKYTVLAPGTSHEKQSEFIKAVGMDYTDMSTKYVTNVLRHLDMHKPKFMCIFIKGDGR